jgi:microcystin-dependent protein
MADQFVAEIRMFAGNFAPTGWALCDGQLMPISQNTALFSLLGTYYGGDGKSTFALPDLQGRSPLAWGDGPGLTSYGVGEPIGQETVSLTTNEMPAHGHTITGVGPAVLGTTGNPSAAAWATSRVGRTTEQLYSTSAGTRPMSPAALSPTGASAPHDNMPPYLTLTFIIALQGIFPPRG